MFRVLYTSCLVPGCKYNNLSAIQSILSYISKMARNLLQTVDMGFLGVEISNIIFSDRFHKLFVYFCLH